MPHSIPSPGPLLCTSVVPPLTPISVLLTGVHVARPDLLPVIAAGKLGAPEPPLCRHKALLDPPATQLGTVLPTGPQPHFTSWEQTSREKEGKQLETVFLKSVFLTSDSGGEFLKAPDLGALR